MLVEYLPQLRFDRHEFRICASPELEIALGDSLSFVLMGEIDFHSETSEVTIEPLLDVTKPFETSVMQFFRYKF